MADEPKKQWLVDRKAEFNLIIDAVKSGSANASPNSKLMAVRQRIASKKTANPSTMPSESAVPSEVDQ